MYNSKKWLILLFLGSIILAVFFFIILLDEIKRPWQKYQKKYLNELASFANSSGEKKSILSQPVEIKQIRIPELNRVDRCVTCHLAVEDPDFKNHPEPLKYHKDIDKHPVEKFGCTICHDGQGRATEKTAAHGNVKHWDKPLFKKKYLGAKCGKCHFEGNLGVPELTEGRRLFEIRGCRGCHRLGGIGQAIGPDLNNASKNHPRSPEWLFKHFKKPQAIVPNSKMPQYNFSDTEANALTMYMLSLTDKRPGGYYSKLKFLPDSISGKRIFYEKECLQCHSINGKGGTIGPDLKGVVTRRNENWLMNHFTDPSLMTPGTIMPQFRFSETESKALIAFLKSIEDKKNVSELIIPLSKKDSGIIQGKKIFLKYGCAGCHGVNGEGNIPNANAVGGKVPAIKFVKESYTKKELIQKIRKGNKSQAENKKLPPPPLYMPAWTMITDEEMNILVDFLFSLYPEEEDNW